MPPQLLSRRKAGKYENVGNLQVDSFLQRNYILHTSKFSCKVKETLETDSIVRTAPTSASHLPDTQCCSDRYILLRCLLQGWIYFQLLTLIKSKQLPSFSPGPPNWILYKSNKKRLLRSWHTSLSMDRVWQTWPKVFSTLCHLLAKIEDKWHGIFCLWLVCF